MTKPKVHGTWRDVWGTTLNKTKNYKKRREKERTGNSICVTGSLLSTAQLLLPIHLIEKVLRAQEEVIDLAALLISLGGVVDPQLGFLGEELADVGHGKDDLLHGAIESYDLSTVTTGKTTTYSVIVSLDKVSPIAYNGVGKWDRVLRAPVTDLLKKTKQTTS